MPWAALVSPSASRGRASSAPSAQSNAMLGSGSGSAGAGAGRNTHRYAGYKKIVLVDYSRTQLEQAQKRLGRDARSDTVKRVVGVPGDRLLLSANRLSINGAWAAYSPLGPGSIAGDDGSAIGSSRLLLETMGASAHPVLVGERGSERSSFGPVVVPAGSYFMMGDNRDRSRDSRWFGAVPRANILGRAVAVVASLDYERGYRPRPARFFSALR